MRPTLLILFLLLFFFQESMSQAQLIFPKYSLSPLTPYLDLTPQVITITFKTTPINGLYESENTNSKVTTSTNYEQCKIWEAESNLAPLEHLVCSVLTINLWINGVYDRVQVKPLLDGEYFSGKYILDYPSLPCPVGYYCSWGQSTISKCAEGKCCRPTVLRTKETTKVSLQGFVYSEKVNYQVNYQDLPYECKDGEYCPEMMSQCTNIPKCPKGSSCKQGKRTLCPPGNYANVEGLIECKICSLGAYTDKSGEWNCRYCNAALGEYQDQVGQTSCKICPVPKFIINNYCKNFVVNLYLKNDGFKISLPTVSKAVMNVGETKLSRTPSEFGKPFTNLKNLTIPGNVYVSYNFDKSPSPSVNGKEVYVEILSNSQIQYQFFKVPCGCDPTSELLAELPLPRSDEGRPEPIYISQHLGLVSMKWRVNSICATVTSITRVKVPNHQVEELLTRSDFTDMVLGMIQNGTEQISTAADFPVAGGDSCNKVIDPTSTYFDDFAASNLQLGNNYVYCLSNSDANLDYYTSIACFPKIFTILWQAKISVFVGAGPRDLISVGPQRGVEIRYSIYLRTNESQITDEDVFLGGFLLFSNSGKPKSLTNNRGEADIEIEFDPEIIPGLKDSDVLVRVHFFKEDVINLTTITAHEFDCNNRACTEDDPLNVWVPFRSFNQIKIEAKDITVAPVSGQISIQGTESLDNLNAHGCPLSGVEVCAQSSSGIQFSYGCSTTDTLGKYTIPITINSKFTLKLSYKNHKFNLFSQSYKSNSLEIREFPLTDVDFKDVTKETLFVDLAGGFCNTSFASPTGLNVKLIRDFCFQTDDQIAAQELRLLKQGGIRYEAKVPAALFRVKIDTASFTAQSAHDSANEIIRASFAAINTEDLPLIDLTDPDNSSVVGSAKNSTKLKGIDLSSAEQTITVEETEARRLVRFQYDAPPTVDLSFTDALNKAYKVPTICGSDRTWILPDNKGPYIAMVKMKQTFPNNKVCTYFPGGKIDILNQLGEEASKTKNPLESICFDGCEIEVQHVESFQNNKTVFDEAYFELKFDPTVSRVGDFSKQFKVTVVKPQTLPVVVLDNKVIITGLYQDQFGNVESFPLVEYDPLLVLWDPPGALSYSYLENTMMQTNFRINSIENGGGFMSRFRFGPDLKIETDTCAGLGFMVCNSMARVESNFGVPVELDLHGSDTTVDDTASLFSFKISMKTANEPNSYPGRLSDMFLLPTLVVNFGRVQKISANDDRCSATKTETVAFDIEKSGKGATWASRYDLESVVIPDLQRALDNPDPKNPVTNDNQILNRTIINLKRILEIKTNDSLIAPSLEVLDPHSEFSILPSQGESLPSDQQPDGYKVDQLQIRRKFKKTQKEDATVGEDDLRKGNILTFRGSGATIEYEYLVGTSKRQSSTSKFGLRTGLGVDFGIGFKALGVGIKMETKLMASYFREQSTEKGDEKKEESKAGFVLGDMNPGDYFDLKIQRNHDFGTFEFTTMGGATLCPHEDGTYPREQPRIQVTDFPFGAVHPNEPAVFELELYSEGFESFPYLMFSRPELWEDDVKIFVDGMDLSLIRRLEKIPSSNEARKLKAIVKVFRGSKKFSYTNLIIGLRSVCESSSYLETGTLTFDDSILINEFVTLTANFLEPCPKIELAGELGRAGSVKFIIGSVNILKLASRNLDELQRKFEKISHVHDARFEYSIDDGSNDWFPVTDLDGVVNITKLESPSLYSFYSWDVSESNLPLMDATIRVRARVKCNTDSQIASLDPLLSESFSNEAVIRIDRLRPKVFTVSPLEPFPTVDEILFTFNEPIRCLSITAKMKIFGFSVGGDFEFGVSSYLLVHCDGSKLSVATSGISRRSLLGKKAVVTLSNVRDLSGNLAESNFIDEKVNLGFVNHEFSFAQLDESLSVVLVKGLIINEISNKTLNLISTIKNLIFISTSISVDRITVIKYQFLSSGNQTMVDLSILPNEDGTRRRLESSAGSLLDDLVNQNPKFSLAVGGIIDVEVPSNLGSQGGTSVCDGNGTNLDLKNDISIVRSNIINVGDSVDNRMNELRFILLANSSSTSLGITNVGNKVDILLSDSSLAGSNINNVGNKVDEIKSLLLSSTSLGAVKLEPCPRIELVGELGRDGSAKFIIGSVNNILKLASRNLDELQRNYSSIPHVDDARFEYSIDDDDDWFPVINEKTGMVVNIVELETANLYSVFDWNISESLPLMMDVTIRIRARIKCNTNSPIAFLDPALAVSNSNQALVRIDRIRPRIFTIEPIEPPFPTVDEIVFTFDEPIRCSIILTKMKVFGFTEEFGIDNYLRVGCDGRKLSITLSGISKIALMDKTGTVTLSNVRDLAGNLAESNIPGIQTQEEGIVKFDFTFDKLKDQVEPPVLVKGLVLKGIRNTTTNPTLAITALINRQVGIAIERITVVKYEFSQVVQNSVITYLVIVDVMIAPATTPPVQGRRQLDAAQDLYAKFVAAGENSDFFLAQGGSIDIVLPPSLQDCGGGGNNVTTTAASALMSDFTDSGKMDDKINTLMFIVIAILVANLLIILFLVFSCYNNNKSKSQSNDRTVLLSKEEELISSIHNRRNGDFFVVNKNLNPIFSSEEDRSNKIFV